MAKNTTISHPVIKSYIDDFITEFEISRNQSKDEHAIFEQYINNILLSIHSNDPSVSFQDLETGTAFGIDGIAIFVADKFVTSIEDVENIISNIKKFDVSFLFVQSKTSPVFNRNEIADFLLAIKRFFNLSNCEIPELKEQWEVANYIYTKSTRFKKAPSLRMSFVTLSPRDIDLYDKNLSSTIQNGTEVLKDLNLFNEVKIPEFLGIKDIMLLHEKITSGLEVSVTLSKQLIPYPKDTSEKIKNGYYGLIKLEEFVKLLTDDIT